MAKEEGVVISFSASETHVARVKTQRSSACKSCASRRSCSANDKSHEMEVDAINSVHARIGDKVVIEMETASLMKGSFLLYIFPVLCMVMGAVIGETAADRMNWNQAAVSALTAFIFLGVAFWVVRVKGTELSKKEAYRPKIVRVLK